MLNVVRLINALNHPIRLRILMAVARAELCRRHIALMFQLPQTTLERHLGTLVSAGLIEVVKNSGSHYYRRVRHPGTRESREILGWLDRYIPSDFTKSKQISTIVARTKCGKSRSIRK